MGTMSDGAASDDTAGRVSHLDARLRELETRLREQGARLADVETRLAAVSGAASGFRRALTRLGDALADTHNVPAMVSAVLETTVVYLRAEAGVFYEPVAGSDRLRAMLSFGAAGDVGDLTKGEGVAGAAAGGQVVVRPGPDAPSPSPAEPGGPASAAVGVPMRSDGHLFGVLALYGLPGGLAPSADDVETLLTLVRQAERAIESSVLYEEARHLSLTDGLTGLWNSRHFALRLSEELSRSARFQEPFALVFVDLDAFKEVNDTYGHQSGNSVLVDLARRLMESTREVDLVARMSEGADEFALLLPRTGLAGALRLAEKVRAAVADDPFPLDDGVLPVTMSLGVAAYPEHGTSEKELKAAADTALYRAKRLGGNRVEHAKVETGPEEGGHP